MRFLILLLVTISLPLAAHHSRSHLDFSKEVDIQGRVSDYDWANPHVYITVDVINEAGETEHWLLETNHTLSMSENGWGPDSLAIGDLVSARGAPNRNPEKTHMFPAVVVKSDGTELWASERRNPNAVPPPPLEVAPRGDMDFAGVWTSRVVDQIKDYLVRFEGVTFPEPERGGRAPSPLNEVGLAMQENMNPDEDPFLQCVGSTPMAGGMFPSHLEWEGDNLTITGEFNGMKRVIHMGEDADPQSAEPSHMGYSVGRIENGELIVETTRFQPTTWGLMEGVDSSAQKRVVERYWLQQQGRLMQAEITTYDPVYLAQPMVSRAEYGFMPNREFQLYECDIEAANRHLEMVDQHQP